MRGQVLGVDKRTGDGVVSGEDGQRYRFTPDDWAHRGEPAIGMLVDFEPHETRALSLFPVPGATPAPAPEPEMLASGPRDRNRFVAAILAFVLGIAGIHRFYTGSTSSAIAMLVLSLTGIGLLLTVPWALIDMVRYLMMSDDEFERRYGPAID